VTVPTIHANGTSRQRLLEGYIEAFHAVQLAAQAVRSTAPNPRDYGPLALDAAVDEHMDRLRRLRDVQDELEALINHCG